MNGKLDKLGGLSIEQRNALLQKLRPDLLKAAPRAAQESRARRAFRSDEDQNFRARIQTPGVLDTFYFDIVERRRLAPHEVEIEVHSASLNFRDVALALGVYPQANAHQTLAFGFDFAGTVAAVGADVTRFQVGDPVMGLANSAFGSFSRYTYSPETALLRKPDYLSFDEATAAAGVLITAYYALCEVGRLAHDERVLIHSAAGGVGLAAIQVAQWIGAEIYATTSSEDKRRYLQSRGIAADRIMDSRSLAFGAETLARTANEGVDVVLNSLAGDAIQEGLRLLRPCGRFLELGRKEILADQPIGMGIFARGRLFSSVDIDFRGEKLRRVMAGVTDLLERRIFQPLPMRTFPVSRLNEALNYLSNGAHIGKAVLQIKDVMVQVTPAASSN